jgi:hypothetical protein
MIRALAVPYAPDAHQLVLTPELSQGAKPLRNTHTRWTCELTTHDTLRLMRLCDQRLSIPAAQYHWVLHVPTPRCSCQFDRTRSAIEFPDDGHPCEPDVDRWAVHKFIGLNWKRLGLPHMEQMLICSI